MRYNLLVSTDAATVHQCKRHGFEIDATLPEAFRHARRGFVDAFVTFKRRES